MYPAPDAFYLKLCFQQQWYSWPALLSDKTCSDTPLSEHLLIVTAKDSFQAAVAMLRAFNKGGIIFPVTDKFNPQQIAQLKAGLSEIRGSKPDKTNIALAVATSGSQSEPAIALISFDNILAHWQSFIERIPLDSSSIWLNCLPLEHIAGAMIVYRCGLSHASMLLHQGFHAQAVWQDLYRYPVSHISLVPAMLKQLLDLHNETNYSQLPEYLRYVIVGGDRLSPALHRQALEKGWPIVISYGMTEACSTIALGEQAEHLTPLKGFKLHTDADNNLFIQGNMVISRYLKGREASFKDGWFKTSDRVLLKQDSLQVLGRNDYMIISGGENFSPEFIEAQLQDAPMIQAVAVGKTEHEIWGHSIAALVVGDVAGFKQWVCEHISSACRPRHFIPVEQIPLTRLDKIDRCTVQSIINHQLLP